MNLSLAALRHEQAKWEVYLDLYVRGPRDFAAWKKRVWDKVPVVKFGGRKAW